MHGILSAYPVVKIRLLGFLILFSKFVIVRFPYGIIYACKEAAGTNVEFLLPGMLHERIQVVVLAAGRGERLRPLTDFTPKPLLQIAKKPILAHTLDVVQDIAHEIVLVIGYKGEKIWQWLGDEYHGVPIRYVEQKRLGGTAHALSTAAHVLDNRFLVLMGDDLYHPDDMKRLLEHPWSVLAKEVTKPQNYGVLKKDRQWYLKEIVENPKNPSVNLVNCGVYVMGREYFAHEPVRIPNGEIGLPQTLVKVAQSGTPIKVVKASFWHPIGYPKDLKSAEKMLTSKNKNPVKRR